MSQEMVFGVLGGLGLFLYGVRIMSEGLQKSAGAKMRQLLQLLTTNRVVALLVGLTVTAVIQSSSATTVMVVSFVNAGLMTLTQAVGIILGANIGTTITAQMIAFKVTKFALPAIGIGMGIKLFAKSDKWQNTSEILLGFGMLFFGMVLMKDAFGPLKSSPMVQELFVNFGDNILLAVLVSTVFTMLVQSSSATVGITMALASSGLLSFTACAGLILGDNIGTTITAQLASIGTNAAAKRTARAHAVFNVVGVGVILLVMPAFVRLIDSITPGDADFIIETAEQATAMGAQIGDKPFIARHVANAHTFFNVINCLLFLPLLGLLVKVATWMVPARGEDVEVEYHLKYLNAKVLDAPEIALGQAKMEIDRMMKTAERMLDRGFKYLHTGDEKYYNSVIKNEQLVDMLQKEVTDFLTVLSQKAISAESSKDIAAMLHITSDIERIGDHAENLVTLGYRKNKNRIEFSETGKEDLKDIAEVTTAFVSLVSKAVLEHDVTIMDKARVMEEKLNQLEDNLRATHIARLQSGSCTVESGLLFIDMITNMEKIGDHAYNIAEFTGGTR